MRGHALFRDAMHFLRSNLYLEGLSAVQNGGVQRLVKIGARHRDVVFESSRHRMPDVMHYAKRRITITLAVGNYTHRKQVINLFEFSFVTHQFAMQRIESLDARFQLRGDATLY